MKAKKENTPFVGRKLHKSEHLSNMYTSNLSKPEMPFEKTEMEAGGTGNLGVDIVQLPMYFASKPIDYTE